MWIQELYRRKWRVITKQIPREVNCIFDILADPMKGFPIGAQIVHVAVSLVDD